MLVRKTLFSALFVFVCYIPVAHTEGTLSKAKQFLLNTLAKVRVTACGYGADLNAKCVYDAQNPAFNVLYKDKGGNEASKSYRLNFTSLGPSAQLSLNLSSIFFVGTDENFFEYDETMQLGYGVSAEISLPIPLGVRLGLFKRTKIKKIKGNQVTDKKGTKVFFKDGSFNINKKVRRYWNPGLPIRVTYINIKDKPGGIIILTTSPGINVVAPGGWLGLSGSIILGGTLTPSGGPVTQPELNSFV